MWWSAIVKEITQFKTETDPFLHALLEYKAEYGFDSTISQVKISDRNELVDKDSGRVLPWRSGELRSMDSPASPSERDPDYGIDHTRHRHRTILQDCTADQMKKTVAEMLARLEKLESAAKHPLPPPFDSNTSMTSSALTVCSILFQKLGVYMDKPLSLRMTKSEHSRGMRQTSQEEIRVQADCSLAQFRTIAIQCKAKENRDVLFQPSFEDITFPSGNESDLSIIFPTFQALCDSIGTSQHGFQKILVKSRAERDGGSSSIVRILGNLVDVDCAHDAPSSAFLVGSSAYVLSSPDKRMTVLCRDSYEFDHVNNTFLHPLSLSQLSQSSIVDSFHLRDKATVTYGATFSLLWRRIQRRACYSTFQPLSTAETFGTLHLRLPCCIFSGTTTCQELEDIGYDAISRLGFNADSATTHPPSPQPATCSPEQK